MPTSSPDTIAASNLQLRRALEAVLDNLETDPETLEPLLQPAREALQSHAAVLAKWREDRAERLAVAGRFRELTTRLEFLSEEGRESAQALGTHLSEGLPDDLDLETWHAALYDLNSTVAQHERSRARREKARLRQSIEVGLYDLEEMVTGEYESVREELSEVGNPPSTPKFVSAVDNSLVPSDEIVVRESSWNVALDKDMLDGLQLDGDDLSDVGKVPADNGLGHPLDRDLDADLDHDLDNDLDIDIDIVVDEP